MVASGRVAVVGAAAAIATAAGCSGAAAPVRTDATTVANTIPTAAIAERTPELRAAANCPSGRGLGRLAFQGRRSLRVLDLESCKVMTLVHGRVTGSIRWSADGLYIAFGDGAVVPSSGGPVTHPIGEVARYQGWDWSPSGHQLAGITQAGLVLGGPGMPARQLIPARWGATEVLFGPDGSLAVSRARHIRRFRYRQQLWLVDPASGERQRLWSRGAMEQSGPHLAEFSPQGRHVLFWTDQSASINSDGQPLEAVPVTGGKARMITTSLLYRDYVANCDRRVVIAAGGWRESTSHKHLLAARPPDWKARRLTSGKHWSQVSPSCQSSGRFVAAAAGPSTGNAFTRFGTEQRSIWVLRLRGNHPRRLTFAADRHTTDESPRVSADGRTILFVRTSEPRGRPPTGRLFALRNGHRGWRHARLFGPIVRLHGGGNYYGHYAWAYTVDWYQPPG
jgi:Tol biopolymer transport system component